MTVSDRPSSTGWRGVLGFGLSHGVCVEVGGARVGWTAVVCFATFMAGLDLFIVNLAFPRIGHDFGGSSLATLSWVLTAYAIVYAALLIPAGLMADGRAASGSSCAGWCCSPSPPRRVRRRRRWASSSPPVSCRQSAAG
jgi:MFS family permease